MKEAIERAASRQEVPAEILEAAFGTVMDGEATFTALRELRPDLPIVLSSGYTADDVKQRFGDQQISGTIEKPFTLESLIDTVRGVLEAD